MRKVPESVYGKWNISVVICDTVALNKLVQYCKQKEKHYGCNDMKFNYIYYEVRITKIKIWKRIMFSVISCFCIVVRCIIIQSWLSWRHHFEHFTVATKNWLTVMECQCHKWPRIYSTCRKHFPVLSSFMTYHRATRLTRLTTMQKHEITENIIRFHIFIFVIRTS
jgi:hypothetical protein